MGVTGSVGVGMTFWFSLPIAAPDGTPAGAAARPMHAERILVAVGVGEPMTAFLRRHLSRCRLAPAADLAGAGPAAVDPRAAAILAGQEAGAPGDDPPPVPIFRLPSPIAERAPAGQAASASLASR